MTKLIKLSDEYIKAWAKIYSLPSELAIFLILENWEARTNEFKYFVALESISPLCPIKDNICFSFEKDYFKPLSIKPITLKEFYS